MITKEQVVYSRNEQLICRIPNHYSASDNMSGVSNIIKSLMTEVKQFADYIKVEMPFINTMKIESGRTNKNKRVYYCNINNISPILGRCTSEEQLARHFLASNLAGCSLSNHTLFQFLTI